MVEFVPPLEPLSLLPPFLACLPTAFAAPHPPPALLPLLSPILRQRVQYMTAGPSRSHDSWVPLLCWNAEKGTRLGGIIESASFEPHPVSGEIEPPEVGQIKYKLVDEETLQAHVPLSELNLFVIYLWCVGDQEGGGNGWRVTELLPGDHNADETGGWSNTISEANEVALQSYFEDTLRDAQEGEEDNDDGYWALYDNTPGRTPAMKRSPAPQSLNPQENGHQPTSDAAYYAQYLHVQPAMDSEDPLERTQELGESTLNGDVLASLMRRQIQTGDASRPVLHALNLGGDPDQENISQPQPSSPSSQSSDAVARLEHTAERESASEIGVKQHISTNIKSLYRLAKTTGMGREEFQSIVQRELEALSIGDED